MFLNINLGLKVRAWSMWLKCQGLKLGTVLQSNKDLSSFFSFVFKMYQLMKKCLKSESYCIVAIHQASILEFLRRWDVQWLVTLRYISIDNCEKQKHSIKMQWLFFYRQDISTQDFSTSSFHIGVFEDWNVQGWKIVVEKFMVKKSRVEASSGLKSQIEVETSCNPGFKGQRPFMVSHTKKSEKKLWNGIQIQGFE